MRCRIKAAVTRANKVRTSNNHCIHIIFPSIVVLSRKAQRVHKSLHDTYRKKEKKRKGIMLYGTAAPTTTKNTRVVREKKKEKKKGCKNQKIIYVNRTWYIKKGSNTHTKSNNSVHHGRTGWLTADPEGSVPFPQRDGQALEEVPSTVRGGGCPDVDLEGGQCW